MILSIAMICTDILFNTCSMWIYKEQFQTMEECVDHGRALLWREGPYGVIVDVRCFVVTPPGEPA